MRKLSLLPRLMMLCLGLCLLVGYAQAATRTVTKSVDTNDGVCDADCSLREAIAVAAPGDQIVFAPLFNTPQTITLSSVSGLRDLVVDKSISIMGPGAHLLRVNAGNELFRVFNVNGNGVNVALNNLTITGGSAVGGGGGINANTGVTLTISHCLITGNGAFFGGGLAITADSNVTITNSTIAGNTALGSNAGGAIHNLGTLTLTNSTISGNTNSSGSNAAGGLWTSGTTTITHTTIADNESGNGSPAGGIRHTGGTTLIRNSIIAGNRNNATIPDVVGAFASSGFNLVGNVGAATGFTQNGDQTGTPAAPLDPRLDPLGNYGGTTPTHRPQLNSPALDQGNSFGSTADQRGKVRPKDTPGIPNAAGGDGADIGAYEASFQTVTKTADTNDGACDADCSLREAILTATPDDVILFASPLFDSAQTITLTDTSGFRDLVVTKSMTIVGRDQRLLTIRNVSGQFRTFNVNGNGVNVALNNLTITGGNAAGGGGGINANTGVTLTISNCFITGNTAFFGGGLAITADSSVTLVNSTISNNSVPGGSISSAGGIHNLGTLTIANSTISGNTTIKGFANGGGIWTSGTLTVRHSTITDNETANAGSAAGGIYRQAGTVTIESSIVAGNRSNTTVPDVRGSFASGGFNLIGNPGAAVGFTQTGDQVGSSATPLNPRLDVLAYYGGPTPTHALLSSSPALDKGLNFGVALDQTGRPRTVDFPVPNASGGDGTDIGAVEAQSLPSPPVVGAVSRQVHGSSGTYDINLPLNGTPGVECRSAGAGTNYQVVVTFVNPVIVGSVSVTSIDGMATATRSVNGAVVTLNLSNAANAQTLGITLGNVFDGTATGDLFVPLSILVGDTNGNGVVTSSDVGQVRAQSGQAVATGSFRSDLNANGGFINASDVGIAKSLSGTQLP